MIKKGIIPKESFIEIEVFCQADDVRVFTDVLHFVI